MGRLLRGLALVAVLGGLAVLAGSAVLQWWEPPETRPVTADVIANPPERVTVEVLNGGGVTGMADSATAILRDAGFDVVRRGNAPSYDRDRSVVERSVVRARRGREDMASWVADALVIDSYADSLEPTNSEHVVVLLGSRWRPSAVRTRDSAFAAEAAVAPPASASEPGWRGILSRLREWADGLNQAGSQR